MAQNSTAMAGEIMMVAAKQGVKRTRRVLSLNLLRGLRKRRVGTHAIEKMAKNLTEVTERQEKVVIKLIDIAIDAAAEKAAIASREADKSMKEAKRALPVGWQRKRFREILREEAQDLWQERKEKNSKKKDHLEAKHKPRKESHSYRGIPISDRALGGEDAEIKVTAIGVEISEDEKEFLKLPKSATDFVGIDEEKVETSIQIMAAKLRMSLRNQEEEGEGGLEAEEQEALLATRRVFDPDTKVEDLRKLRVTDMPTCKRITVPEPAEPAKEAKIQVLIDGLEEAMRKNGRKEKSCPKAGRSSLSTLTDQQRRGKESLLRREKAGELIMVGSDKSGKNIPMSVEMYKLCMEPHIKDDSIHSREEVAQSEKILNGAATQILRAFKCGEDWGHEARLKSACGAKNNEIPSLNQLVKDHKATLKTRPVCRARQAPNGNLGELLCTLLDPFVQEADRDNRTEVKSTEELCSDLKATNDRILEAGVRRGRFQRAGNLVVGSKDVEEVNQSINQYIFRKCVN